MVSIGVIGLGSVWEDRYRPVLGRLGSRLRVRALYDPVFGRAELTARDYQASAESGLVSLARRPDIDAILLLDTAWHGCEALRLLCSAGKPIYIAADLGDEPAMLQALHWTAVNYGMTLMPELGARYTPASNRLRELMATRLGRPIRVRITLDDASIGICSPQRKPSDPAIVQSVRREFVNWFDWLRYILCAPPLSLKVTQDAETGPRIRIEYSTPRHSEISPSAELRVVPGTQPNGPQIGRPEVECEHGIAVIHSPTVIRWKSHSDEKYVIESLLSDRSEFEVMLDHFCRRVVGGLIPVADLADISHSLELIKALRASASDGSCILLDGTTK